MLQMDRTSFSYGDDNCFILQYNSILYIQYNIINSILHHYTILFN